MSPLPHDALDLTDSEVAARFAWARSRGHPRFVWPDVQFGPWRTALAEFARVTTAILGGRHSALPLRLRIPEEMATTASVAAYTSGLGPLLGYWIEAHRLEADPAIDDILELHLRHGRIRAERLKRVLAAVLDALTTSGIKATLLKGLHTGAVYFPDPGTCISADIDIAVAASDFAAAEEVLKGNGLRLASRISRPRRADWIPADGMWRIRSLYLAHADDPWAVELHDSLDRYFFGVRTVRLGPLTTDRTESVPQLHPNARVLRQPWLLAYLALQAAEEFHYLQLKRLVELALVIRRDSASGRLDWGEFVTLLQSVDGLRFVYPALEMTERLLAGTVDSACRRALAVAALPRMRRVVSATDPEAIQSVERLTVSEALMWARGPWEVAKWCAYMIGPRRTSREGRGWLSLLRERLYRIFRWRVRPG